MGVDGVERLVEPFVGRHATIDRAAFRGHGVHRRPLFNPKNAGPDQWVPVIALAAADRLL